MSEDAYRAAAHRVQTAIAFLMNDPGWKAIQPKHMRVGIDMLKAEQGGLATLLIEKGVFTKEEYVAAMTKAAEAEADSYEKMLQAVLGDRRVQTR